MFDAQGFEDLMTQIETLQEEKDKIEEELDNIKSAMLTGEKALIQVGRKLLQVNPNTDMRLINQIIEKGELIVGFADTPEGKRLQFEYKHRY